LLAVQKYAEFKHSLNDGMEDYLCNIFLDPPVIISFWQQTNILLGPTTYLKRGKHHPFLDHCLGFIELSRTAELSCHKYWWF
jgi:hypothetical protein